MSTNGPYTLNKVILPIIRRVMPSMIANEIINVQPMNGPVPSIMALRVRYHGIELNETRIRMKIEFPDLWIFLEENDLYVDSDFKNVDFKYFVYVGPNVDISELKPWVDNTILTNVMERKYKILYAGGHIFCFKEDELNDYLLFKLTWA
jgi:hypothetical protein